MITALFKLFAIAPPGCEKTFFGLLPWYHYLPTTDFSGCSILHFNFFGARSDAGLVLLAIVSDLLRVAGIVAVAFVIYGGFQYVTSQGQSDRTARAQNTITDALIGLAVAITAIGIVSFLGSKLGGP